MLKLSIGIFFIVCLFTPSIQQYSDDYCAKYIATFPLTMEACIDVSDSNNESSMLYKIMNETSVIIDLFTNNNCDGVGLLTLTHSPNICKNSVIITPLIRTIPTKNWREYIVLSGSNLANDKKENIIKSIRFPKKTILSDELIRYIDSPILIVVDFFLYGFLFIFIIAFFISII